LSGLSASQLTCIKRDRVLFKALSLQVSKGDLLYLRGPNGAGKTSLLRILTGLSLPEEGDVVFDGVSIFSSHSNYTEKLVYLGHKSALNPALSAVENLHFWAAQHRVSIKTANLYEVLDTLGLVGLEEVPVKFLSAGQQRRVALSRLWLKTAELWVLDEPFTALDVEGVSLLEKLFANHCAAGGMIITTSHQALSSMAGKYRTYDLEYNL